MNGSTGVSLQKTEAREQLRKKKRLRLNRPVFFVPGWTDQGGLCWTEPYTEGGAERSAGWEYTIQDWIEKVVEPADRANARFVKLVADEQNFTLTRFVSGPRRGRVKSATWEPDPTSRYEHFFQFAELLKAHVRAAGVAEYDLVGHSMGGLDIIAATMLDHRLDDEPLVRRFMTTAPLEGVRRIITVATPFQGSPPARVVERTQLDEWFRPAWSPEIRKQAEAMSPQSDFIRIIVQPDRQRRLVARVPGGVHTFGSRNDLLVPDEHRMIEGATNHPAELFALARHSMILGITQDPRLALRLFDLLAA